MARAVPAVAAGVRGTLVGVIRATVVLIGAVALAACGGSGTAQSHDAHASGEAPVASGHENHPIASGVAVDRPDWSPEELYLLSGFRTDAIAGEPIDLRTCARQFDNLPEGAQFGVVCRMEHHFPAEQVGAYLFENTDAARAAYEDRLNELGVTPNASGDVNGCGFEGPMVAGADDDGTLPRSAVILDEQDIANVRILHPSEAVYAGVLGRSADCAELAAWSRPPENQRVIPNAFNVWLPPPPVEP